MDFRVGDHVRIKEGTFAGFVGKIYHVDEEKQLVVVLLTIEGHQTPVEVRCEQIEAAQG